MANSILKLKVETSEYDQKLANAAKGIRHLADVAHKGAGDLTGLEKSEVDYIKALGDMETKSRSASGQVRELSSTYKELKVVYDQLNEVEKADEGGKALAASLETLKQRAQEAKAQLDTATQSLNDNGEAGKGTSGIMEMLKDKFTVNIDAIKLFNVGLQAAEGALSVAKDAFFASEATVDEWGRIVDSSKSLYEGFLTAINNGDISGYLTRIDQIVQAAREAYNELDKLGTMRTIQGPQFSKQEAENTRMRMMVMTGRYIAPAAGSGMKAAMAEGTVLTPEQIRRIEQKLENGMKSIGALTKNELAQTGKAIDAYYNKLAVTNGMSRSEFRQGTSSWDEFSRRMQGYEEYKRWDAQARAEFARQGGRGYVDFDKSNPYAEYRKWGTFRVDKMGENSYNDLVGLIKQQQQQTNQLYSQMGQTYRSINRADGVTVRDILNGGGGGGGGTTPRTTPKTVDPIADAAKAVSDAENSYAQAIQAAQENLAEQIITNEQYNNTVLSGQRKLAEAYYSAYQVTGNEEYLNSYREAAEHVREQQAAIDANTAAQKAAKEAAEKLAKETKEKADQLARTELTKTFSAAGVAAKITDIQKARQQAVFGSEEYNSLTANLVDATTISNLIKVAVQDGIDLAASEVDMSALWTAIASGDNIDDSVWEDLVKTYNDKLQAKGRGSIILNSLTGEVSSDKSTKKGKKGNPFIETDENGKETVNLSKAINGMADGISKAVGGIEQLGIKIPDGLKNVLGGIQTVTTIISGIASTVLAISAIAAADAIIPFARGGIVGRAAGGLLIPGNSMSGDRLRLPVAGGGMIGVNSGELILNRSQQDNIASQLEGGGLGNMQLEACVSAEDLIFVLNNNGLRRGYGKFIKD